MTEPRQAIVRGADEGRVMLKLTAADTAGAYAMIEFWTAPGSGSGLHLHHNEDEIPPILEGGLTFQLGEEQVTAGPGQIVLLPTGVLHACKNTGAVAARSLITFAPGGAEGFFAELAALAAANAGSLPRAEFEALCDTYRMEFR